MKRYQQNLKVENNCVYSYNTHVATIIDGKLIVKKKYYNYSHSTTKHYRYVAQELGLYIEIENN